MAVRDEVYLHVPVGAENAMTGQDIHFRMGAWALSTIKTELKRLFHVGKISRRRQFRDTEGQHYGPTLYWREGE